MRCARIVRPIFVTTPMCLCVYILFYFKTRTKRRKTHYDLVRMGCLVIRGNHGRELSAASMGRALARRMACGMKTIAILAFESSNWWSLGSDIGRRLQISTREYSRSGLETAEIKRNVMSQIISPFIHIWIISQFRFDICAITSSVVIVENVMQNQLGDPKSTANLEQPIRMSITGFPPFAHRLHRFQSDKSNHFHYFSTPSKTYQSSVERVRNVGRAVEEKLWRTTRRSRYK